MTFASILALFSAMVVLAIIPGPGVFIVTARSMSKGFAHGAMVTAGIVAGDYVFIFAALFGLLALAELMGGLFIIIKYLSIAYLFWLGISLIRQPIADTPQADPKAGSHGANFALGLFTTLGNPKAILFYVGFFPAFIDPSMMKTADILIVLLAVTLAVGGVMLAYAYAASRTRHLFNSRKSRKALNVSAGSAMLGSGIWLATKT